MKSGVTETEKEEMISDIKYNMSELVENLERKEAIAQFNSLADPFS